MALAFGLMPVRGSGSVAGMRYGAFWLAVWLCGWGLMAPAAARGAEAIAWQGREWVALDEWGRAQGYAFQWNRAAKTASLSRKGSRLVFAQNSRQAVFNGTKVWLSWPLTLQNDRWLLSRLDVDKTLVPLLRPAARGPARKVRTIVLDPGHGGKDPGNRDDGAEEKRYTLLLAQLVRARLEAAGYKVILTRNRDTFVELSERPALANRVRAELFLSLHFNAHATDPAVRGLEVFTLTPASAASSHDPLSNVSNDALPGHKHNAESLTLAYQLQTTMVSRLGMVDRGVKRARFAVLRDAAMPAVLVEGGFMSAPEEARKITDPKFRQRLAEAIVEGVGKYRKLVER